MRKIIKFICMLVSSLALFSFPVFAEDPITAEIPVEATSGSTIKIEAVSSGAPTINTDKILISSTGKGKFSMTVTEAGTYEYKVYQIDKTDKSIKYDDRIYYVTLFVSTSEETKKLTSQISVAEQGNTSKKVSSVKFVNEKSSPTPSPTPTPTPTPVTIKGGSPTNTDAGIKVINAGVTFIIAIALLMLVRAEK